MLDADFSAAGALSLRKQLCVFGNSDGVFLYHNTDYVNFEVVVTHKDGAAGFGGVYTANLKDCNIDGAFRRAYEKAKAAINPVPVNIGSYTVILEPEATAGLVRYLLMGLNGDSFLSGKSFASGKLGEKLFGETITICDDVNNPAILCCPFDAEGRKRIPLTLINNGVVENLLHDSKTAKRAGVPPTGHAVGNAGAGGQPAKVVIEGGDSSLDEMIGSTDKGILVTHFHYINSVNPTKAQLTGLTRDGTFLIENGKIAYPIRNMRFTESMLDAFSNVTGISREHESCSVFGCPVLAPAMRIENFHFTSGQS